MFLDYFKVYEFPLLMRLKGNPQYFRFNYWMNMYQNALANMRSRISSSLDDVALVKMYRN